MRATIMRQGGSIWISSLLYLVSKPNTVISSNDSHDKLSSAKVSNKSGVEEESCKISCYLHAMRTLSKLPIMMQTQIGATNMRWGGTTFKSSQPCLMPMSNTVIDHSWLSHYVAKQKCDDQIWNGTKILQEVTIQQLNWGGSGVVRDVLLL